MNCSVNPLKSYEYRYLSEEHIPKAKNPKKVLIVGGGLAGLEAARVAGLRGHNVVLVEESNDLGGVLRYVLNEKIKWRIKRLIEWYGCVLCNQDIEVKLNTKVDADIIQKENPDVVILATGSDPLIPKIPGVENAVLAEDVLSGKTQPGKSVIIIGGGLVGCELAIKLSNEGHNVTIIEALPQIAMGEPILSRMGIIKLLDKTGVRVLTCAPVVEIHKSGVETVNNLGIRSLFKADTIILSVGRKAKVETDLMKASKKVAREVYLIGDAKQPRKIIDAVREGFWTGVSI